MARAAKLEAAMRANPRGDWSIGDIEKAVQGIWDRVPRSAAGIALYAVA